MAENINVGGRLHSIATGNVVAGANEILDDDKGKKQNQINAETDVILANHSTAIQGLNSQNYVSVAATAQTTSITDVLPATGAINTVYRVGNWDGSQFDTSKYSEYAWNESSYVPISTKTQIGEVFDISAYHATGGELAKYVDLAAALGTNGANVPQPLRKGGMMIKYVQSSDNKYVQYRLMTTAFSTTESDWQGVTESGSDFDNPTAEQRTKIPTVGAVADVFGSYKETYPYIYAVTDKNKKIYIAILENGDVLFGFGVPTQIKDYIQQKIEELSLNKVDDIITFIGEVLEETTLSQLLSLKVNKETGKSLIDDSFASSIQTAEDSDYVDAVIFRDRKLAEATRKDGTKVFPGKVEVSENAILYSEYQIEYIEALVDNNRKIIYGFKKDGDLYLGFGVPTQIKEYIDESISGGTTIISQNDKTYTRKALSNLKRPARASSIPLYTPFVLLHASDIHGDEVALQRMVEYKEHYSAYIDEALISGDIVPNYYEQDIAYYRNTEGAENFLLAVGNHDTAKYENGAYDWTYHVGQDSYNRYIKDFAAGWGINAVENKCYYYKDYADYGIRMIVIDCMEGASESQLEWFENTALGTLPEGYSVLCVSHYPYSNTEVTHIDCAFDSRQGNLSGATPKSFLMLVSDFIEGGGKFICWLCGHTHRDYLFTTNDTDVLHPQLFINIDTASIGRSNWSDTERIEGTKSRDLFNLVAIDTYQKIIKVIRVGADMDCWMRSKKTMSIQYASNDKYSLVNDVPQLIHCE